MHLPMTLHIGDVAKWIIFSGCYAKSAGGARALRSPGGVKLQIWNCCLIDKLSGAGILNMMAFLQTVTEMDFLDPASWQSLIEVSITARGERGLEECEPVKLDTLIPTKTRRTETVMAMEYRGFLFIVGIGESLLQIIYSKK